MQILISEIDSVASGNADCCLFGVCSPESMNNSCINKIYNCIVFFNAKMWNNISCILCSDGRRQDVHLDKITFRISKLCYNLNMDFVEPVSIDTLLLIISICAKLVIT